MLAWLQRFVDARGQAKEKRNTEPTSLNLGCVCLAGQPHLEGAQHSCIHLDLSGQGQARALRSTCGCFQLPQGVHDGLGHTVTACKLQTVSPHHALLRSKGLHQHQQSARRESFELAHITHPASTLQDICVGATSPLITPVIEAMQLPAAAQRALSKKPASNSVFTASSGRSKSAGLGAELWRSHRASWFTSTILLLLNKGRVLHFATRLSTGSKSVPPHFAAMARSL